MQAIAGFDFFLIATRWLVYLALNVLGAMLAHVG